MGKRMLLLLALPLLFLVGCSEDQSDNLENTDQTESTVYEIEYDFENDSVLLTVEVVSKNDELLYVDIDSVANITELSELHVMLDRLAFVLEVVTPDGNERLCMEVISEGDRQENVESSCRTTPEEYPAISLEDVDEFEDFMLLAIYQDTDTGFDSVYVTISLLEETYNEVYEEN